MKFDIVVVGGGHAGSEASHAASTMGLKTCMFCMSFSHVGNMPCNPSIGGSAKGIVVKEIDALGGIMGKVADQNALQYKMLNLSKGPGVHALRAQADKITYPKGILKALQETPNLTLIEQEVVDIIVENGKIGGVLLKDGTKVECKAVILTTGTYMEADILRGSSRIPEGPDGDKRSTGLSPNLKKHGISLFRLKTGTPQRIKKDSIDYSVLEPQYGSNLPLAFSFDTKEYLPLEKQIPCYLTYTNSITHKIILDNLDKSAMYGGYVKGIGPRYCPSLENAEILKYAYAIEYDAIEPMQFDKSLALRNIKGLYGAGQIIGTSGYEEAAALGLMAGINAALYVKGEEPFILNRHEAYIGVMIDDLVTKGTKEPYRLLSSRSEYRLLTRSDNALSRLFEKGYKLGLNSEERAKRFANREEKITIWKDFVKKTHVGKNEELLNLLKTKEITFVEPGSKSLEDLIKSKAITYDEIKNIFPALPELTYDESLSMMIDIQYVGYIDLEKREAERMMVAENYPLPLDIDYMKIEGISMEAREKLNIIKPHNIGEASRITNVHPADINVLLLYLKTHVK